MSETAKPHLIVELVRSKPGAPCDTLPLRVVRKARKNLDLVSPRSQPTGQPGRVWSDAGRLGSIVDSQDRDSDRSMVHGSQNSGQLPVALHLPVTWGVNWDDI